LLKNRPPGLVDLYGKLEALVKSLGAVEIVTRDRYALFRTTRIFTDLTVMRDALRVVIHLGREVRAPYFIKVGRGDRRVSHVTLIRTSAELRVIAPLLREAYELAVSEESHDSA
jgi:predicted transport protein